MDSVLDNCFKDCHQIYFHKFKYECRFDFKFKTNTNNEMIIFTVKGKNIDSYDLNNKFNVAREEGFMFVQINKLPVKIYSHIRYINKI